MKSIWIGMVLACLSNGCATGRVTTLSEAIRDESTVKAEWSPENLQAIDALIASKGKESAGFDEERPPIAVFEWDNTIILNSLTEALYLRMVDEMLFSFDAEFWKQLPSSNRGVLKADINSLLPLSQDQREKLPEYEQYRKKMRRLWVETFDQRGELIASRWVASLLTGLSIEEIRRIARVTLDRGLETPASRSNGIGVGLRFFPEMVELVDRLHDAGFQVWIVSEVPQWALEEAAARLDIPADRVIGTLPTWDSQGVAHAKVLRVPHRKAKVDAIRDKIRRLPDFVAGDDNGDIEMLMMGQGPRLVMDQGKMPLMEIAKQRGWLIQKPFLSIKTK